MARYQTFEQIPVWQKAHEATLLVYKVTSKFPNHELYGLISQIRRSVSSIPANIAEGFGKNTTKELIQFLYNARGSCIETQYHLILCRDLEYLDKKTYEKIRVEIDEVGRQLNGWINSLKKKC